MEQKEVEIGNPVTIGQVTLIPVVEFSLNYWRNGSRYSCSGIKQPVSIVVVSPAGKKAFRTNGGEVPLDQFIEETPGIREVLESI
ncbi:hypothetical protein ACFLVS_06605 [Chloroflexota bacterium]